VFRRLIFLNLLIKMHSAPLTFPFSAACIPDHSNYLEIIVLIVPFKYATIKKCLWVANFFASIFSDSCGPWWHQAISWTEGEKGKQYIF
jgi:hypothetical protein